MTDGKPQRILVIDESRRLHEAFAQLPAELSTGERPGVTPAQSATEGLGIARLERAAERPFGVLAVPSSTGRYKPELPTRQPMMHTHDAGLLIRIHRRYQNAILAIFQPQRGFVFVGGVSRCRKPCGEAVLNIPNVRGRR